MKIKWKSNEEADAEEAEQEKQQNYQEAQDIAQVALINRLAEDYLLSEDLPEEEKDAFTSLFELYTEGTLYPKGKKVNYKGDVYEVIQKHTSQLDWKPNETLALYKLYYQLSTSDGVDVIPEWKEPVGDIGLYHTGDLVSHDNKVWESTVDDNVWEPGKYGWIEY